LDISSRFPKQKEILPVYAIIVVIVYGWTIHRFNYYLSGWLYFLNLGEITSFFAYSMVVNLLESLLVLLALVILAFALPKKWFRDAFVARGVSLSILALGLMMMIANQFKTRDGYPAGLIHWSPILLVLIGVAVCFLGTQPRASRLLEFVADRAIIFLYISIPLSIVSLMVVLFRLVF
jgi:hypothetical protein